MPLICPNNASCLYLNIMLENALAYYTKAYFRVNRYSLVFTGIRMTKIKDLENLFSFLKTITQESGEVGETLLPYGR